MGKTKLQLMKGHKKNSNSNLTLAIGKKKLQKCKNSTCSRGSVEMLSSTVLVRFLSPASWGQEGRPSGCCLQRVISSPPEISCLRWCRRWGRREIQLLVTSSWVWGVHMRWAIKLKKNLVNSRIISTTSWRICQVDWSPVVFTGWSRYSMMAWTLREIWKGKLSPNQKHDFQKIKLRFSRNN